MSSFICCYADRHYRECRSAECRGAVYLSGVSVTNIESFKTPISASP